jgi:putative restriction endonuclease
MIGLIGQEVAPLALSATKVIPTSTDDLDAWERRIEQVVAGDQSIPETDRVAIIRARKGQGLFKERVRKIESRCRITGVENPVPLVASHCKPWRDATNEERLDGENGLLLTPSIDHLFDRGFIGFEDNGRLIISPVAHHPSLQRMGIDTSNAINVGAFTAVKSSFSISIEKTYCLNLFGLSESVLRRRRAGAFPLVFKPQGPRPPYNFRYNLIGHR